MMGKKFIFSLFAAFLLAVLFACTSSAPDEITPLYQEYPAQELPSEEDAEIEADVLPDDSTREPLTQEPIVEEPLTEEPFSEPEPEVIESEELSPEIPVDEDWESIESLRESMEALREAMEALREELEALRELSTPAAPEPTPPSEPPPLPEPAPPSEPPPITETPPPTLETPPPPPEPTPQPLVTQLPPPISEPPPTAPEPPPSEPEPPPTTPEPPLPEPEPPPPEPEPPPPEPEPLPVESEPPVFEPPPPIPPPEPPSFLGPAEPVNPPPEIEQVTEAALPELPGRVVPETPADEIIFSRTVRVTVGQVLEIPFRGTGWVYLGELGNRRGIDYESRRLDFQSGSRSGQETIEGQSFIFSVDRAGTYILRFYKQDFIQDYIINDNVQVIAGERDENTWRVLGNRVIAEPRWPPVTGTAAETVGSAQPPVTQVIPPVAATETVPAMNAPEETPPIVAPVTAAPQPAPPIESPAEYVRRARAEFDAGRVESALGILDAMRQNYPGGTDEAWLLYGQLLEANSPSRDVRTALEYYRRLVNEFPFSDLVEEGLRRIAYLERYYFNIR